MLVLKRVFAGLSLGGAALGLVLLFIAAFYAVSVLFWSLPIMLVAHWAGGAHWSYWWTCTHWGLLAPLVLG